MKKRSYNPERKVVMVVMTVKINLKLNFHQFLMVILMKRIPPWKTMLLVAMVMSSCEVYGPGKFCDGQFCRPCWKALDEDFETPPPKRKAEEKALSDSKKPKVGPPRNGGTDSPVP